MTKGIGWDIGIKNLAYCIIEPLEASCEDAIQFNNTYYKIHKWADISLVSQIESNLQNSGEVSLINTVMKCCSPKTDKLNAPICGNNAVYCSEELTPNGEYKGYCKNHFKKLGVARMPEVNVRKCYHSDCSGNVAQVLKQHIYMGYCKKHVNEMIKTGGKATGDFLKINRAKTTSKIDINHLGIALFQELDKIKTDILQPDVILLENQPVLKNPTMKSMQMFLYSYFLMRHMESRGGVGDKKLQCYTASKKLDLIKFFETSVQTTIQTTLDTVKSNYQKNKKQSIMMVEHMLKNNKRWKEFFDKNPKQDDLADSFLMTLHYFEKNNLAKLNQTAKKNELAKNKKQADNTQNTISNKKTKGNGKLKDLKDVKDNLDLEIDALGLDDDDE